jgi:CRP/FNR family transcriptional regulator
MRKKVTTDTKIETFFGKYPLTTFKKGEIIIKKSTKRPDQIYYLESGFVGLTKINSMDEKVSLNIFKKKSFFPLIFVLGDIDNHFDFEALTSVEVRLAPVSEVVEFLKEDKDVLYSVTNRLSRGMNGLLNHLETLMVKEAKMQILDTLKIYAERFGEKAGRNYKIQLEMTHKNIADNLGLTRETVTRELNKLVDEELITKKGKYIYLTPPKNK